MSRRSWTKRLGASHPLVDESAMDFGREPRAPPPPPAVKVKRKKVIERPAAEQASLLPDESTETLDDLATEVPVEAIEQRPNAVIRNGAPQLLRGLMLPLCPSKNANSTQSMIAAKGSKFPLTIFNMRDLFKKVRVLSFQSSKAKEYVKTITEYAIQRGFRFHTEKPLRMDIVVCPKDRREIDSHNFSEVLLDVFQEVGVYENDSQVKDLRVRLGPIIKGGRLIISLWEITYSAEDVMKEMWG